MDWYVAVLKKYAVFTGRARRKEYWYFVLFTVIISIALGILDSALGFGSEDAGTGFLGGLYTLAVLIPSIAVTVRRLHDTDRTGWWVLISFVPVVGFIVLLVFMALQGTEGDNRFGPNPKAIEG